MLKQKTFRPDLWLLDDVEKYAKTNGLVTPATNEFNFSKALHGLVRELKTKAIQFDKTDKDAAIYRTYMEKLAKEQKPFRCGPMASEMTILECYQCQQRTKENPERTPQDVRECPRNKPMAAIT